MSETRTWILYRHKNQNMKLITGREYQVTFWVESETSRASDTYHPVEHHAGYYENVQGLQWIVSLVRLRAPRNSAFPDHVFPIGQAPEAGRWPLERFLELYEPYPRFEFPDGIPQTRITEHVRG